MTKRILLPLERSDDDTGIVSFAQFLAKRRNAEILLMRIEEWPVMGPFGFGWSAAWRAGDLDGLKTALQERDGVPTTILASEAAPSGAILQQARRRNASLILMSYRQERALLRVMYGHAAERVLRESTIPVLVVPPGRSDPRTRIARILYPYELSEGAVPGLRHVVDYAQLFESAVYLQHFRVPAGPEEGFLPSLFFRGKEDPARVAKDEKALEERLLGILKRREVPAQSIAPAADGSRDVLEAVRQHSIDLVVLAKTRGSERSFSTLARRVLQGPAVPVLLSREGPLPQPLFGARSRLRVEI